MAAVLLMQPLFVFALVEVRNHTDLASARAHVLAAFDEGVLGTDEQPPRLFLNRSGHHFTECSALNVMLDDNPDLTAAALMPKQHFTMFDPCPELHDMAAGVIAPSSVDYSRYWHGYRVYMWPLLEHFGLQSVRYINAVFVFCAVALFYWMLRAAIGPTPAFMFFLVLMSLTDIWRIWVITPHFVSMFVILAGAAAFAFLHHKASNVYVPIVCAAVLGSVFNFVDFLVNPPMMPMLLSFFVLAPWGDQGALDFAHVRRKIPLAAMVVTSWFAGYALTWMVKWVLATYLSADPHQELLGIIQQIQLRLYGQEDRGHITFLPLLPTATMILQSFISAGSVTVGILAAAFFVHVVKNGASFDKGLFALLLLPTLVPIIWFELLSNHTQTHSHFTYRSESAAIALFFGAAMMATKPQGDIRFLLVNLWRDLRRRELLKIQ
jgi:hypothetical protein